MGNSKKQVCYKLDLARVEEIDAEADELGLSRSAYLRQRIEAGRLLFQTSGSVDTDLLKTLVEEGAASFETDTDTDVAEITDDVTQTVREKLPADPDRAASKEEIRQMVFGTKDEQLEEVKKALQQLGERGETGRDFDGDWYHE